MSRKQKYIYWIIMVIFSALPIMIDYSLKEKYERFSVFIWSLFLVPNILIIIMHPKWKIIIGSAAFFSFLKYSIVISDGVLNDNLERILLIAGSFVNGSILITVSYFRIRYNKVLEDFKRLAVIDTLTGLYNRRYFDLYMEKIIQKNISPLTLIMLDIDHFKLINDNNGHQCGDEALKHISEIIKSNVRSTDVYVRYGGEEFAIILPNTNLDEGRKLAESIRKSVVEEGFTYKGKHIHLSISIGAALYSGENVEDWIEQVDQALYKAKENGRNQVVIFER
ncbi:GGDEF domain-containing protein [Neobacillus kokaensis]|uniref:GGDEF domain-containing protein n=1 Tax=Neobacillus kokaensis TaxID=2759023 RepID=A0ABQ3N3E2_9BACI|nr:GGDEF domain-containing protein [Neobacillus kokaensis]GHH99470.1 hypothetical protein AM1BK_30130 [Neobacillus kokaensis]